MGTDFNNVALNVRRRATENQFVAALTSHRLGPLARERVVTLQINVGKLCNQACHHCHVEAGPTRTEIMTRETAERIVSLLARSKSIEAVDLTGGAPELNSNFRWLVTEARRLDRHVIDRCNLTVLFQPGMEDLASFLATNSVEITASLPCYTAANVAKQRGNGVFEKSLSALKSLNALGYGHDDSPLTLNLVYNPVGAFLPPPQAELESRYKAELGERFGITFNRLFTITNMPISRFLNQLIRDGQDEAYLTMLASHFNPTTVDGLMCRTLVSVGWDGQLYDCDFNQMLELPLGGKRRDIWMLETFDALARESIATANHCFGCTAGAGSSCGGAIGTA